MFASESCVDKPFGKPISRLAQQHASWLGEGLQTGRDIDRVAKDGQAIVSASLELPKNPYTGANPDANLGPNAIFGMDVGPNSRQALQNGQRHPTCAQRRVFTRDRRPENHHDAVTEDILNSGAFDLNDALDEVR